MRNLYLAISLALCTLLLSGCGFQLRGTLELPAGMEPLYLAGDGSFTVELRNILLLNNIELAEDPSTANYQLRILKQEKTRKPISISGGSSIADFQLMQTVEFSLADKRGQLLFDPVTVKDQRILRNDPNQIASTNNEEQLIRKEMSRNIAAKIVRRLRGINIQPTQLQPNSTKPS
jgi:LPS-assembly lipoprotein